MRVIAAGSVAVLVVLGICLVRPAPLADLDLRVCDLLAGWAGPGAPSGQVMIVEIDEKSLEEFGRWPWPRDLIGKLSRKILDAGAAVAALDMMFPQEDAGNDEHLAGAITGQPVVAGYVLKFGDGEAGSLPCLVPSLPLAVVGPNRSVETAFFHATGAVCSAPPISRAASGSGFLNVSLDRDGVMRSIPLIVESGGRYYPSLALSAVNLFHPVSSYSSLPARRTCGGCAWISTGLRSKNEALCDCASAARAGSCRMSPLEMFFPAARRRVCCKAKSLSSEGRQREYRIPC